MKFSKPLANVQESEVSAPRGRPAPGGYVMNVVRIEDVLSKKGNPMLVFHLDIAAGTYATFFHQHPIRYYREYSTDLGLQITKGVLNAFVRSNQGSLSPEDVAGDAFDHNRLQGLLVGAVIEEGSNGYLEIKALFDTDSVDKVQIKPKAATAKPVPTASSDVSFDDMVS